MEYFGGGNSGRRVTSLVITGALLIVFTLLLVQTLRPLIRLMRDDEKVANNGGAAVGDPTADPQTQPDPASANNPPIAGTNESGVTQTPANPNASTIPPVVGTNPALPPFAAVPLTNAQATATAMPVGGVNGATASAGPNVPAGQVAASGANVGQSGTNVAVNGLNSPGLNGASAPPSVNPAMTNASPVTNESPGVPGGDAGQAKPQAFPGETALPGEVGKLVTDDSLLLQFDGIAQVWRRANREAPLASPVQLVSPTLFRNRLILNGGVDLTMLPSTSVILTNTQRPAPVIAIDFGRVVLGTTAADTILALNMHGIPGELQFSDLRSVVAINVLPQRKVGVDPQLPESSQPRIELNVLQGQVTFRLVGGDAEAIYANQRWVFEQNHPLGIEDVAAPPAWIDEPPITPTSIEHFAKLGVMERLKSSPNATEQALRDATNHRKSEVVALAAQILLETGHAEMMFGTDGMLNRANQKAYWGNDRISHGEGLQMMSHFDALQAAINRGPLPAAKVQQAIQQLNAVEAGLLYRLLWGFSDQQLADGEDEKLVQMLDHPTMSVRVLAFENLRWITNTTLGYRPDAENRRPDVLKWQARLRKGDIRWATVTTPAPTPAAAPPAEAPAPNNAAESAVTAPPPEPGAVPLP